MGEFFQTELDAWQIGIRLLFAVILGAVVGWEREAKGRVAGLRTHIMVALGAALFTLIGAEWFRTEEGAAMPSVLDPLRVVAAVVGGVGFLGAGAIIHGQGSVRGLTTAAGLWVVSSIGVACGAGFYLIAGFGTVLAVVTLTLVRVIEPALRRAEPAPSSPAGEERSSSDTRR